MTHYEWLLTQLELSEPDVCQLWPFGTAKGYGTVCHDGRRTYVHRFVLEITTGAMPAPGLDSRHLCGVALCFNPHHLAIGTRRENMADMKRHGTLPHGEGHWDAQLTADQVRFILTSELSGRALAAQFGVSPSNISHIRTGKGWRHLPEVAAIDYTPVSRRPQGVRIRATEDETGYSITIEKYIGN